MIERATTDIHDEEVLKHWHLVVGLDAQVVDEESVLSQLFLEKN